MSRARNFADLINGIAANKITSGSLDAARIPDLPTSKITSGTFADARLSSSSVTQHVDLTSLSASNLTSGTVPSARLSLSASDVPALATSKITSGTFADARLSSSSVTQHVDLSNLNASNLTSGSIPNARYGTPTFSASNLTSLNASQLASGTIPNARVPSGAVTQHVSAVTNSTGTWTPSFSTGSISITHGARYQRVGDLVTVFCYIRAGGSITNNTTVIYMNGLPFTSRNTGNTYDYVGSGFIVTKSSTGIRVSCAVRSNSSSVYFLSSNGDLRAISDYQGLSGGSSVRDTSHYATQRNFQGAFDTSQDAHMLMKLSYLV